MGSTLISLVGRDTMEAVMNIAVVTAVGHGLEMAFVSPKNSCLDVRIKVQKALK